MTLSKFAVMLMIGGLGSKVPAALAVNTSRLLSTVYYGSVNDSLHVPAVEAMHGRSSGLGSTSASAAEITTVPKYFNTTSAFFATSTRTTISVVDDLAVTVLSAAQGSPPSAFDDSSQGCIASAREHPQSLVLLCTFSCPRPLSSVTQLVTTVSGIGYTSTTGQGYAPSDAGWGSEQSGTPCSKDSEYSGILSSLESTRSLLVSIHDHFTTNSSCSSLFEHGTCNAGVSGPDRRPGVVTVFALHIVGAVVAHGVGIAAGVYRAWRGRSLVQSSQTTVHGTVNIWLHLVNSVPADRYIRTGRRSM